jgi:hypothetical protein
MAAGDKVQIGQPYKVEYGTFALVGFQPTSVGNSAVADVETIRDTRNAVCTHIITNPGDTLSLTCYIEASASITPPIVGSYISVTPPNKAHPEKYILASPATVTHGNSITTISLSLLREDSMETVYNVSATLASSAEDYDIVIQDPVAVAVTLNDASAITSIVDDYGTTLTPTTHYTFVDGTLTITAAYINAVISLPGLIVTLTINFNVGNPAILNITGVVTP